MSVYTVTKINEIARLMCNFYLSMETLPSVYADPSMRYTLHAAGTLSNQQTTTVLWSILNVCQIPTCSPGVHRNGVQWSEHPEVSQSIVKKFSFFYFFSISVKYISMICGAFLL